MDTDNSARGLAVALVVLRPPFALIDAALVYAVYRVWLALVG